MPRPLLFKAAIKPSAACLFPEVYSGAGQSYSTYSTKKLVLTLQPNQIGPDTRFGKARGSCNAWVSLQCSRLGDAGGLKPMDLGSGTGK